MEVRLSNTTIRPLLKLSRTIAVEPYNHAVNPVGIYEIGCIIRGVMALYVGFKCVGNCGARFPVTQYVGESEGTQIAWQIMDTNGFSKITCPKCGSSHTYTYVDFRPLEPFEGPEGLPLCGVSRRNTNP